MRPESVRQLSNDELHDHMDSTLNKYRAMFPGCKVAWRVGYEWDPDESGFFVNHEESFPNAVIISGIVKYCRDNELELPPPLPEGFRAYKVSADYFPEYYIGPEDDEYRIEWERRGRENLEKLKQEREVSFERRKQVLHEMGVLTKDPYTGELVDAEQPRTPRQAPEAARIGNLVKGVVIGLLIWAGWEVIKLV